VHADDLARSIGLSGNLGDRNGRSIGSENGFGSAESVKVFKKLKFNGRIFGGGFHNKFATLNTLFEVG
jgi:hypothetical protein